MAPAPFPLRRRRNPSHPPLDNAQNTTPPAEMAQPLKATSPSSSPGAEALGFDSAWAMEQVLESTPFLSPIETMTYAAACTERMRLGCAVLVTPLHSPVQLAKSLATLDQLSRSRIDVGVATGGKNPRPV